MSTLLVPNKLLEKFKSSKATQTESWISRTKNWFPKREEILLKSTLNEKLGRFIGLAVMLPLTMVGASNRTVGGWATNKILETHLNRAWSRQKRKWIRKRHTFLRILYPLTRVMSSSRKTLELSWNQNQVHMCQNPTKDKLPTRCFLGGK